MTPAARSPSPELSGRIVVTRNTAEDLRQREVIVYLDGERVGALTYGRRLSRDVAPGRHSLRVYNTLVSKTIEVDVAPGGVVSFDTGNRAAGCLLGWLMLVGVGPMGVFIRPAAPRGDETADLAP